MAAANLDALEQELSAQHPRAHEGMLQMQPSRRISAKAAVLTG
jgi:hypothetical protein